MGNGKSEISLSEILGTLELWNSGTLELWNAGTLEPSNPFLNPLRGKRLGLHHCIYCPSSPTGNERKAQNVKHKEIPFMTYLPARNSKPNALRFTLIKKCSAL